MKTQSTVIEAALSLLEFIRLEGDRYNAMNKQLRELQGDFATVVMPMNQPIEDRVVRLLDEILGGGIASYYLYEAVRMKGGGRIEETDGSIWPILTIDDVRAYAEYLSNLKETNR